MKAISVKQPWASLIVSGVKDIENRKWKTNFRGRVLIHASGKMDVSNPLMVLDDRQKIHFPTPEARQKLMDDCSIRSSIIGSVEIIDCVTNHPSEWAEKSHPLNLSSLITDEKPIYNWVLSNPIQFKKPIPAKGKLSFWEFNLDGKI